MRSSLRELETRTFSHDEPLSLDLVFTLCRRHLAWVVGGGLIAGGLAAALVLGFFPPRYRSVAQLVVLPPAFTSALSPETLSMHSYRLMLESGEVLQDAEARLKSAGRDVELRLEDNVEASIVLSRGREERSLAPILRLSAEADDAVVAAEIANTWGDAFAASVERMVLTVKANAAAFVEAQYPKTRAELKDAELEWLALADGFSERIEQVSEKWERSLTRLRQKASRETAEYQQETSATMDEFLREKRDALGGQDDPNILKLLSQLVILRTEMARSSPTLVLEKTVPEESLWEILLEKSREGSRPADLREVVLFNEEVNEAYKELVVQTAALDARFSALVQGRGDEWEQTPGALADIQRKRTEGLSSLLDRQRRDFNISRQKRASELEKLRRERDVTLNQISRRLTQLRALDSRLRDTFNEAVLAKGDHQVQSVFFGSRATARDERDYGSFLRRVVFAGILGSLLGGLLSVGRRRGRQLKAES